MTADMYLEHGPGTARGVVPQWTFWPLTPAVTPGAGWPEPYTTWYGGEFPSRQAPQLPLDGWRCPGCGRCWNPRVDSCTCAAVITNRTEGTTTVRLDPSCPVVDDEWEN